MWRGLVIAILSLVVISASACGSQRKAAPKRASPAGDAALVRRLRSGGFTVSTLPGQRGQRYEQAVTINAVDWTSTHAFDVSVYVFSSSATAKNDRKNLIGQGRFPSSNRWRQVGHLLFVGSTDNEGGLQCTVVEGKPECPALPKIPAADFLKLVAVATAAAGPG